MCSFLYYFYKNHTFSLLFVMLLSNVLFRFSNAFEFSVTIITLFTPFIMLLSNVLFRFFNAFESFVTKITLLTFVVWLLMLVSHVPFHFFTTFKLSVTNITVSWIIRTIPVLSTIASKLRFAINFFTFLDFAGVPWSWVELGYDGHTLRRGG